MFYVLVTHENQSLWQMSAPNMRHAALTKLQIETHSPYLCIVRYPEGGEVSSTDVIMALREMKSELESDLALLQAVDLERIPDQQTRLTFKESKE